MFGLSIAKILLFLAVAAIVFVGWRKLTGLGAAVDRLGKVAQRAGGKGKSAKPAEPEVVDLVRDPETGSYTPRQNTRPHD
jgi:Sec-independent protein translocase protein TatA